MSRKPRMYLPGIPAHIVQRGNNRNDCFFAEEDYRYYLLCLGEGLRRYNVSLHAYVLMTNHVHLLMTPENETGISQVMQHLGRQYVAFINKSYKRSGTLWEGRHKASLISAEDYLLASYRYIELNPVAANIVKSVDDYPWSSYAHNALGLKNNLIKEHDVYLNLGLTPDECQANYRQLVQQRITEEDKQAIKKSFKFNYPLGNAHFKQQIESSLGRSIGYKQRGRPPL